MNTLPVQEYIRQMFLQGELRCEYGEPKAAVYEYKRWDERGNRIESRYYCKEHVPVATPSEAAHVHRFVECDEWTPTCLCGKPQNET